MKALMVDEEVKRGVLVEPQDRVRFGTHKIGANLIQNITITNTSRETYHLRNVRIGNEQSICQFSVKVDRECKDVIKVLEPGDVICLAVSCLILICKLYFCLCCENH